MKHHNFGKIIAENFRDCNCPSKIIYRSDIRDYISTQIRAQIFKNANKKNIKKVIRHFNLMSKDWNKIQEMIKYSIKTNNKQKKIQDRLQNLHNIECEVGTDFSNCYQQSKIICSAAVSPLHNKGQRVGGDFSSSDQPPKVIHRTIVRAFIYKCVYINSTICNASRKNIDMVMDEFKMQTKDRNKVKQMILGIINRNNNILPPILHETSEDN